MTTNFETIRSQISEKFLLIATIATFPIAIFMALRWVTMGGKLLFVAEFFFLAVLVTIYFLRKKIEYRKRMYILNFIFTILAILSLKTFGLFGFGHFMFFFMAIINTVMLGWRYGVRTIIVATIVLLIFLYLVSNSFLTYEADFNQLTANPFQWIYKIVIFICYSAIAITVFGFIYSKLEQTNIELLASDERYLTALDSVNEVVWEFDFATQKTIISNNQNKISRLLNLDFSMEFENRNKMVHPDDIAFKDDILERHFRGETPRFDVTYRVKTIEDKWCWIQTRGKIISYNSDGTPLRLVGTVTDVSDRVAMEQKLQSGQARYSSLFMNANDTIILVKEGIIIEANLAAESLFHTNRNEIVNCRIDNFDIKLKNDLLGKFESINRFLQKNSDLNLRKVEAEYQPANGDKRYISMNVSAIDSEDGIIFQLIIDDITEKVHYEQTKYFAIIDAEERERTKLAADLHDDVGPLISSVNMYLSLLNRENVTNKQEIIENMGEITKNAISTIREISNNLSPHTLTNYGLIAALNSTIQNLGKFVAINFEQNIDNQRFSTTSEIVLYRIIKELLNNTLKHANATQVTINITKHEHQIVLKYRDNGVGFDQNMLSQVGVNKGLGLFNIVNRINTIKSNYILETDVGKGFYFELELDV